MWVRSTADKHEAVAWQVGNLAGITGGQRSCLTTTARWLLPLSSCSQNAAWLARPPLVTFCTAYERYRCPGPSAAAATAACAASSRSMGEPRCGGSGVRPTAVVYCEAVVDLRERNDAR